MSNQAKRAELAAFHADAGGMANPTVLSVGEAQGQGFYLDEKSLDQAARLLVGKSLKSYLNHDTAKATKRTGEEIGYLSRFYREGDRLRAGAFEYFESFKKQAAHLHERLVELTRKIPDALGFSPVISYRPVWVLGDGREVDAELGQPPPRGAVRQLPSARILDILSADIVGKPAVNLTGFLSAETPPAASPEQSRPIGSVEAVDAPAQGETPDPDSPMTDHDKAKLADLEAKVANLETVTAERDAKVAELSAATAKVADLEKQIAAATQAHTAALEAKVAELQKAHADEKAKLETEHKAKVAELEQFDARKLGIAPVKIAHLQQQVAGAAADTPEAKLAHYEKLPAGPDKKAFREKHWNALLEAELARAAKTGTS